MNVLRICGVGILCLVSLLCVKNLKENFAPFLRIASLILFFSIAADMLLPLINFGKKLLSKGDYSNYAEVILKALGIAYLTSITSGICRDCGENSIAGGVENLGRIELLLLAMPLFEEVLKIAEELLSW